MTVAIHQPNYFPWLGYFFKIYLADRLVFLDDVQFSRDGFTRRTSIRKNLHLSEKKFLSVPVQRTPLSSLVREIEIVDDGKWINNHLNSILESYRKSRYFNEYMPFIRSILNDGFNQYQDLASFNIFLIEKICEILDIRLKFSRSSEYTLSHQSRFGHIAEILKACGAQKYISGTGAITYNDSVYFRENNITCIYGDIVKYLKDTAQEHELDFIPTMSILEALMNTGAVGIRQVFSSYRSTLEG